MKLKALAVAAALIGAIAPAHAAQWWSPKTGSACVPWPKSPHDTWAIFALNGYPEAHLVETAPGNVILYLSASPKSGGFVFTTDRAACDRASPAIDQSESQYK